MGKIVKSSTFKSGNSVAVRLPKEFGIGAGEPVELEFNGMTVQMRRDSNPALARAKIAELVRRLDEIGPVPGAEAHRDDGRIEFPDRPGLY